MAQVHIPGPQQKPSILYRRLMERLPVRVSNVRQAGGAIQSLRFNAAQERLWQYVAPALDHATPLRLIILKARRMGMSTFIEALLTATCVLQDWTNALVVAHKAIPARRIWDMSKLFVDRSPLRKLGKIKGHTISFRHSILELATAGTPDAARGSDLTACHLSEVAFWQDASAMLAILQCLPRAIDVFSIAVIESTANGMVDDGALFYDAWGRAESDESGFTPVFLPWHMFPQYTDADLPLDDLDSEEEALVKDLGLTMGQLNWRRRILMTDCEGDVDQFNQEYPATAEMAFIVSGQPFFRLADLIWLEPHIEPGVKGRLERVGSKWRLYPDSKGYVTVFRNPEPGHQYVIGADSAMGHTDEEHSKSAAVVLDMATLEQVAEFEGAAAPHQFAHELVKMGRLFNDALLFPEVQASGGGGGRELIVYIRDEHHYPNIGGWRGANDRIRPNQPILYGWETTSRTKPQLMARVREVIMERSTIIHSRKLLTQLRYFGQKDSGATEALSGHDDLFMAMGIALMGRFQNYISSPLGGQAFLQGLPLQQAGIATQPDLVTSDANHINMVLNGTASDGTPKDFLAW